MTHRVTDYQLPSGQLWWTVRYIDGERVSETVFTYEGQSNQTWYFARAKAAILLREMGLIKPSFRVEMHSQANDLHSPH